MRLKNDAAGFAASFNITPPYQMVVLHSSVLIYPREVSDSLQGLHRPDDAAGSLVIR